MPRDWTAKQFAAACARNGFTRGAFGLQIVSADGKNTTSYGYTLVKRRGEWFVHGRKSLARALKLRAADEARHGAPPVKEEA